MRTELVGREAELAALAECLDAVLGGHPRVALCSGEPGIGKTRVAEELAELARTRDVTPVWGLAVDSAGAPPYWPWRQVLRAVGKLTDLTAIADEHRSRVDLARLAPDVFGECEQPADPTGSTEDRFRQFDAVGRLLRQVTDRHPLLIVFDDAHWADHPSLLLLQHLSRAVSDERLLVLVNCRDTERQHGGLVTALLREPVTRRIHLRGLTAPAVARQLAGVVGHDVADGHVEQVHALTGGNPFFVGEMGRVLVDRRAGASPPLVTASVREAIAARLERLSPGCVPLLQAASIVGREFSTTDLAAIVGLPVLRCLGILDETVAAGFVETGPTPGEHRFVHALVRDAIEADLGSPERVRLHRMAAEAIESIYGHRLGPRVFDLARHWAVASVEGERVRATGWIKRAAKEAMRGLAYEEGARLFRQALSVGTGELDEVYRCRLLLSLGAALHLSADTSGRQEACLEAAAVARGLRRADLLAAAALVLEAIGPTETEFAVRQLCEEALASLGPEPTALRARVTARFAEASIYCAWSKEEGPDDYAIPRTASEQALALAERCDDPAALVAALRARRLACSGPDGLNERVRLADRMLAIGRETANPGTQMWAHLWHIDAAFERGDLSRVSRELELLAWCVQELRGPLARFELLRCQAVLAQAQGRFGDALRLAAETFAGVKRTAHSVGFHERAGLLQLVGHHVGHEAVGSVEVSGYADVTVFERELPTAGVIIAIANAHLLKSVGRIAEAAAVFRSLGPVAAWRPSPHALLCCYAFGIGVAIALDASDDVAVLRELLSEYRGHHVVSGAGQVAYTGPVELWLGIAAQHLGLLDAAAADLDQAVQGCAANGAAGFHAEAQYELAGVLVRRGMPGDVVRARSLLDACARQASVLGMGPVRVDADALMERLVAAGPLTRREWEVAELVSQGLTNRVIAQRLYLSERTAQTHVQHILTKLDLSNRSQITAWTIANR